MFTTKTKIFLHKNIILLLFIFVTDVQTPNIKSFLTIEKVCLIICERKHEYQEERIDGIAEGRIFASRKSL